MTREIRFRAWDIKNKEMLYDGIELEIRLLDLPTPTPDQPLNRIGFTEYEQKHFHIMQFTGLLDKNGKEIFENDVVLANGRRQVVEFKFGKWLIVDLLKDDPYTNMLYDFIHDDGAHLIEIIGNRFENPELLNPPQGK